MNHIIIAGVCLSVTSFSALAADCYLIMCKPAGDHASECTVSPSLMSAAMPLGLTIDGIRGHTAVAPHDRDVSYSRTCQKVSRLPQPVSLDEGSIYGAIQISGTLHANGVLHYEPNDGGDLWFLPEKTLFEKAGPFFRKEFETLKLDAATPQATISPPKSLKNASCWIARATMSASGFDLVVGDTSSAGNYVRRMSITNVHSFRRCELGR